MSQFSYRTGLIQTAPSPQARALFLILVAMLVACASDPVLRTYQTIAACDMAAQTGVRAFGIAYQTHKAENPAVWADRYEKAQAAYASYVQIANAAQKAAEAHGETTLVLAAVNEALSQLIFLLNSFGVKT